LVSRIYWGIRYHSTLNGKEAVLVPKSENVTLHLDGVLLMMYVLLHVGLAAFVAACAASLLMYDISRGYFIIYDSKKCCYGDMFSSAKKRWRLECLGPPNLIIP